MVGTRLIGGMAVVIPGYLLTLVGAFFVQNVFITALYNQPSGTYSHYLAMFLTPTDLAYSLIKAVVFCIAVTLIHCYYGFFTTGGPAGVGKSSGRAVRASLVTVMVLDFTLTVPFGAFNLSSCSGDRRNHVAQRLAAVAGTEIDDRRAWWSHCPLSRQLSSSCGIRGGSRTPEWISIAIDTPYVGQGVREGTAVVMHGVQVGVVKAIYQLAWRRCSAVQRSGRRPRPPNLPTP